ncbi:LysR family transcriptional regulator [Bosea caraganae]|uniref:LysR family transcriptional regulator n=1 Tax=Bosea caraganae TaxID=2763117 RepID=A0A370L9F6_9HYPH|nr:LysR family transcriptional regulator [Bosea caraganae]RDJ26907.1 LysR family transcriptional regulator [Bosea caraganae]RDJ30794.1 LysR family transcriptional regulator [Bosea caraganae]
MAKTHSDDDVTSTNKPNTQIRPRDHALSPALLARVFHQPSLIYFNAVAECLSVREAGRRLNIASSAVTRQIAQLEDALGMALFQRDGRRLTLAPAGEILYRHARRLTLPLEAAVSELDMLRGLKTGSVRIATVESVGLSVLPQLIADFGRRYPRLHLDVSVVASSDVIARLADERADVGFGFVAKPSSLVEVAVRRDVRIGVVMRPDHPLAAVPHLTLAACIAHPMAVAKPEISIREVIEPFLQQSALILPPLVEVDSIRLLVELALIGGYASVMTPIGVQNEIKSGTLLFRPLEDQGLPTNRFGLMVRAGVNLHFAPAVFYDHAKHHFGSVELPGAI